MQDHQDPLFAGMTRPPVMFGLPQDAFAAVLIVTILAFMFTRNPAAALLGLPLYGAAKAVCAKDPRMFRYLWLAKNTRWKPGNRSLWQASSYSPTPLKKR